MSENVSTEPGPSLMLPLHGSCHAEINRLLVIVKDLERQIAAHSCALSPGVQGMFNSDDGRSRP